MSLPKCKLCGAPPDSADHDHGTIVWCSAVPEDKPCVLGGRMMSEDQWRALMAPPVVTDAMVERGAAINGKWNEYDARKRGRASLTRAVLEAALKE